MGALSRDVTMVTFTGVLVKRFGQIVIKPVSPSYLGGSDGLTAGLQEGNQVS